MGERKPRRPTLAAIERAAWALDRKPNLEGLTREAAVVLAAHLKEEWAAHVARHHRRRRAGEWTCHCPRGWSPWNTSARALEEYRIASGK